MNKRRLLIGFGVFLAVILAIGAAVAIMHYLTVTKPLDDAVAKYKACAESSLSNPADKQGMACRDNYRKATLRRLADILDSADYSYSSSDRNPSVARRSGATTPDSSVVPYLILGDSSIIEADQPKNLTYFVTQPSNYFYSNYTLCSKVIEPVSIGGQACRFTFLNQGTLHTTATSTGYLYVAFYPSGEYSLEHAPSNENTTRYVLGACLEDGSLFAIASPARDSGTPSYKGTLFAQPTPSSLKTTGPYPHSIQCQ